MKKKYNSLEEMVGKKARPADDYQFDMAENAKAVEALALENPGLGIPVHPDVAAHMGAFEEKALADNDEQTDNDMEGE